jgi:hypothetical protein
MGMLSKFGNKVMSKFGSDTSTGKLKSGDVANKLYSAFNQYLGQSGEQPTWKVISGWLQSNKYPIDKAKAIAYQSAKDAAIPKGPGVATRAGNALKKGWNDTKAAVGKGIDKLDKYAMSKTNIGMREGRAEDNAPLDSKTVEKIFMAAAQQAAVITQQNKQNKMNGGGQQNQRQRNNGQQNQNQGNTGQQQLSVQQGGKSQDGDAKLAQRVSNLEAEVAALKGSGKKKAA